MFFSMRTPLASCSVLNFFRLLPKRSSKLSRILFSFRNCSRRRLLSLLTTFVRYESVTALTIWVNSSPRSPLNEM